MQPTTPRVHFLHIGKTGGSAIRDANERHADPPLVIHPHSTTLRDIPAGEPVVFAVRDPCDRFVSGFNSRRRKGLPRYHVEWSADEATAFGRFPTADSLARALSDTDDTLRLAAADAMHAIAQTRRHLSHWLGTPAALRQRQASIVMILDFARLAPDVALLSQHLGLHEPLALPTDPIVSHRTPPGYDTRLSPPGRANLERWYRDDIVLHRACLDRRAAIIAAAGTAATR